MATQKFAVRDIKGLTPAVDKTVSEETFAIDGTNYIFDSRGPKSAFGSRLLTRQRLGKPQFTQGMRVRLRTGDRSFLIDCEGIWEWVESVGSLVLRYETPNTILSPHRWTYAYLNGYVYFAHPRVGILALDLETNICLPHRVIGTGTPTEVLAITTIAGRLAAITPTIFAWSAPSDGKNFTPTLGGAGFQIINERVSGSPIMLTSYARGCLTWTTGGVLRSEFTGDAAVFRHRALNTEYRPVNPFCTCKVDDDTVVILDERGLFQSNGEAPTPFAPLFNEFLINFLQDGNYNVGSNLRVEWDELRRLMYISASRSYADPIFESCFVLYPPMDKWGQFNDKHYGIFPTRIQDSERADDYYGYTDELGYVRYFAGTPYREASTLAAAGIESADLYTPARAWPTQFGDSESGVTVAAFGRLRVTAPDAIVRRAEYYAPGASSPVAPVQEGLNSRIKFGLFRPTGPVAADEMSEVINLTIRSVITGPESQLSSDYNIDAGVSEDYNLAGTSVDYGVETANYVNHKVRIIGTLDGETEYQSEEPHIVGFERAGRYYACSVIGVWHMVEVSALDVGESFHIRTFEFTAASAGRLL